jgi:hypothetical protein
VDKIRPGSSPGFGTNIKLMMGNRAMILIPHSLFDRCPESPVASPAADNTPSVRLLEAGPAHAVEQLKGLCLAALAKLLEGGCLSGNGRRILYLSNGCIKSIDRIEPSVLMSAHKRKKRIGMFLLKSDPVDFRNRAA